MQKRLYVKACVRNSAGVKVSGCEYPREKAYVCKIVCVKGYVTASVCQGVCV